MSECKISPNMKTSFCRSVKMSTREESLSFYFSFIAIYINNFSLKDVFVWRLKFPYFSTLKFSQTSERGYNFIQSISPNHDINLLSLWKINLILSSIEQCYKFIKHCLIIFERDNQWAKNRLKTVQGCQFNDNVFHTYRQLFPVIIAIPHRLSFSNVFTKLVIDSTNLRNLRAEFFCVLIEPERINVKDIKIFQVGILRAFSLSDNKRLLYEHDLLA